MEPYCDTDWIVAQASGVNVRAPLAVIRLSGKGVCSVLDALFKARYQKKLTAWRMIYGDWYDQEGHLDDVMLVCYSEKHSYTGQEMFEVFCHGNPLIVEALIESLLQKGVRRARPGEFTMRAVIEGRLDLLEAEAVSMLVACTTRYQADLVRRQAHGPLVVFVRDQVEEILQIQSHIEAAIDYGEEDIDALQRDGLLQRMQKMLLNFVKLERTAQFAQGLNRGFRVLLTGEPNVGKSTLFNALVRQERAIVTELPGTTRDLISEQLEIGGLPVVLMDSAGVRDTEDRIETLGIEKIFQLLHDVDLVIFLTSKGAEMVPYRQIQELPREKWMKVVTKADMDDGVVEDVLCISALTGEGLAELEREIVVRLSANFEGQSAYLINQRQQEIISAVTLNLQRAMDDYQQGFGEEVLSASLNMTRRLLGELTGETTVEDILDRMFSNFCLGK